MNNLCAVGRACLLAGALAFLGTSSAAAQLPVLTNLNDFFLPGTQPNELGIELHVPENCATCHGNYNPQIEPMFVWAGTMMAQAARDPLFYACLAVANQDARASGDLCIRCHVPRAWLGGRSTPTNGSAFQQEDRSGVHCDLCHRMIDPFYEPGVSPPQDLTILNNMQAPPAHLGSAMYALTPNEDRRGPFPTAGAPHQYAYSPFHLESALCGTCHDVSNPVYDRQPDDTYVLNDLGQPAPSFDPYDQFPLERTYSEWLKSSFADGPIDMNGRFGGNRTTVSTCQDCHMPDVSGRACSSGSGFFRDDMPLHDLTGANTWVPLLIPGLWPTDPLVGGAAEAAVDRAEQSLRNASNVNVRAVAGELRVRVFNETGHKLPTGYPEGRRMWLNVRFFDQLGQLVAEHGAYNALTGDLTTTDTKVYEARLGIDAAVAALTGLPEGESFHFAINNVYYLDNRIPPRGFEHEAFRVVQAAPVAYSYADGQFWDDTLYSVPPAAVRAEVRLFHQVASKEYVTFLRDANTTNHWGNTLYQLWLDNDLSPPTEMAAVALVLGMLPGDLEQDGDVDLSDFLLFQQCYTGAASPPVVGCSMADLDADDDVDLADFLIFQQNFTGSL